MTKSSDFYLKQRQFIFKGAHEFQPVTRSEIYDARHIFPQIEEVIGLLINFINYREKKAFCDSGVLLHGPAGTGKTMFACYTATESKANFIYAAKFPVELKSGVHVWQERDVEHLFSLSKKWAREHNRPVVLFFDQFDDFLKIRPNIISPFETQLEGFWGRPEGVFVIATSKKGPDEFGGSIFRAGRIGIHIALTNIDRCQQKELLDGFLGEHEHEDIDTKSLVYLLNNDDSYPAAIKSMVKEAYREALKEKQNQGRMAEKHLLKVILSKALGPPTGVTLSPGEESLVRIHETGHYIVGRAWGLPCRFISVKPGLRGLGGTFSSDDSEILSFKKVEYVMALAFGSREAEKIFGITENTGWRSDFGKINEIVEDLIGCGYRNRELLEKYGLIALERKAENTSQKAMVDLEKELKRLISRAEGYAKEAIEFFGKETIQKIADTLAVKPDGIMLQKELDKFLEPKLSEFHKNHEIKDQMESKIF